MTPAQAAAYPNFVTDVPVQGPTDPGMRSADCWYAQNVLPKDPSCCGNGPVPSWARGEAISLGGLPTIGFGASADIFATLTADQQRWVMNALNDLNTKILATTGTSCSTWAADIQHMTGCFQVWYNANYATPKGPSVALRTDSVFDQMTLDAIKLIVSLHPSDFTPVPVSPPPDQSKKGLSTGAVVGIAAAGAALLGGIYYAVTR